MKKRLKGAENSTEFSAFALYAERYCLVVLNPSNKTVNIPAILFHPDTERAVGKLRFDLNRNWRTLYRDLIIPADE